MQKILVNVRKDETRVAVLEEDRLVEIYIDSGDDGEIVGNIYTGLVKNKLKSMQAYFVDIGQGKNGCLFIEEAAESIPKSGNEILVQVKKDATDEKGAYLTQDITINGKFMVLMPFADSVVFSKKIGSGNKKLELSVLIDKINIRKLGIIVRNDILNATKEQIEKEYSILIEKWDKIYNDYKHTKPPTLLYKQDISEFVFNNMVTKETIKIVVNEENAYKNMVSYINAYDLEFAKNVEIYEDEKLDMFDLYGVESQIKKARGRRYWLKSGAEIIFDKTEAMTVIDVDTSKFIGKNNKEQTIYKTNIEAAKEIARQIRLRNISGIIIIDFINMSSEEYRKEVVRILKEETSKDRVKTVVLGMTKLGLVEMTRQKTRKSLVEREI